MAAFVVGVLISFHNITTYRVNLQ